MEYDTLIKKALNGESVNAAAKRMGFRQRQLAYYVKAENLPDCDGAIILAEAAGVSIEEAVRAIAKKKAELRPESARSFLRPAMASVLTLVLSIFMLWSPPPSTYASERFIQAEQVQNRPSPPVFTGLVPEEKSPRKRAFFFWVAGK